MAPVGQAATHQGFSQWKQGMKMYAARGRPPISLGPTAMIWHSFGPGGSPLLALHWISQEWQPMQFLVS
jgi:hypothetical protein